MRAAQYDHYGAPDVLYVANVDEPKLGSSHALVRVISTSVNPVDDRVRDGAVRVATGWWFPKGTGLDFYGEVVAVGDSFGSPGVGSRVWGFLPSLPDGRHLAAAEFVSVKSNWVSVAPAPASASPDLGSLPLVGSTALSTLWGLARLGTGERLLVRGASGGVGSAAVQIGKAIGAHVTGMASSANLEYVRSIGADVALDYRAATPANIDTTFDVILDLVGRDMREFRRLLTPTGRFATTATTGIGYTLLTQLYGRGRIRPVVSWPNRAVLTALAHLVDSGGLTPQVDQRFALDEIAAAHAALPTARGKVLVTVAG